MFSTKTLIMIPVYNAEEFIVRTLESCLDQTLLTEIWVVDNCSTDNTQEIVKSYEKKETRVREETEYRTETKKKIVTKYELKYRCVDVS